MENTTRFCIEIAQNFENPARDKYFGMRFDEYVRTEYQKYLDDKKMRKQVRLEQTCGDFFRGTFNRQYYVVTEDLFDKEKKRGVLCATHYYLLGKPECEPESKECAGRFVFMMRKSMNILFDCYTDDFAEFLIQQEPGIKTAYPWIHAIGITDRT